MWSEGLRGGLACLRTDPILGLKRLVLPVSYWRTVEFAYAWRQLHPPVGARVLDVGSPKDLAVWLARARGYAVTSVDVLQAEVDYSARYAAARGVGGTGSGRVHQRLQDARALDFADASFDAAYSISVLEHIPDEGDSSALREIVRVVRPGGRIVLTVPFANSYRETFVSETVYEREFKGEPMFFERHYDTASLARRLTNAPATTVVNVELWGERLPAERLLGWHGGLRAALSPIEPLLALASLCQVHSSARAKAAFVTLERTT